MQWKPIGGAEIASNGFISKGGGICKYWKLAVKGAWWKLQVMEIGSKWN